MSEISQDEMEFWTTENTRRYENAIAILIEYIKKIDDELYATSGKHMIRHIEKRLKTNASIEEKLKRKGKYSVGINVEKVINDLAGVRIICFDIRQVYTFVKAIKRLEEVKVIKEKDYIAHPKEGGYQSYHMILEVVGVKVELQLRTILMDAWSSLETVLVYKKTGSPSQEIAKKIHKFSKWSKKMDRMVEEMLEEKEPIETKIKAQYR